MGNWKLLGKTEEELQKQIEVVRTVSDIHVEFGLDKCAETVLKKGKFVHSQNFIPDFSCDIREIQISRDWRKWSHTTSTNERKIDKGIHQDIKKSKLNAKNKITAFEALAVPILSSDIINWRLEEIRKIDRKTRMLLKVYKVHHPKADIGRLRVKRKEGGRGLLQI